MTKQSFDTDVEEIDKTRHDAVLSITSSCQECEIRLTNLPYNLLMLYVYYDLSRVQFKLKYKLGLIWFIATPGPG